jgi:uncharacterized DUF497 family protein
MPLYTQGTTAQGLSADEVVVVIFTQRQPDIIRVISLRKAKKHEREGFEKALQD